MDFLKLITICLELAGALTGIIFTLVSHKSATKEKAPVRRDANITQKAAASVTGDGNIVNVIQGSNNQIHYDNRPAADSLPDNSLTSYILSAAAIAGIVLTIMITMTLYNRIRPLVIPTAMLLCLFSIMVSARSFPQITLKNICPKIITLAVLFAIELPFLRPAYFFQFPQLHQRLLNAVIPIIAGAINASSLLSFAFWGQYRLRLKKNNNIAAELIARLQRKEKTKDVVALFVLTVCVIFFASCIWGAGASAR